MKLGRLAFREEGSNWVAYWAKEGTMEGAVLLGSIRMNLVVGNAVRKQAFMDLMKACFADTVEELHHVRPSWSEPHGAPESERSGRA